MITEQKELESLRLQLLNYKVYNHRKNLRFYGIPKEGEDEDTRKVKCKFLETTLQVLDPWAIEFQLVHRLGKKETSQEP